MPLGLNLILNQNVCIKVYEELLSWHDARQHCKDGGGDVVSMPTKVKWDSVTIIFDCE